MISQRPLTPAAFVLLVLICAVWGTNQTAIKIANEGFPPILQAGLRSAASALCLVVWCLVKGTPFFRLDRTLPWGLLAGLLFTGEFLALYVGLTLTDVSRGAIFIYVSPFVTAIGAHFLAPGERLDTSKLLGLLAAFAGVVLVFSDGLVAPKPGQIVGDLLCLTMGVLWGLDMINIKVTPLREVPSEQVLFYALAISAVLLTGASQLFGEPFEIVLAPRPLAAFAYTAIVVSFLSYVLFIWFIKHYPATFFGAFIFLSPIFGVATAALMLGEPVSVKLLAALALTSLGIWLVNRPSTTARGAGRADTGRGTGEA